MQIAKQQDLLVTENGRFDHQQTAGLGFAQTLLTVIYWEFSELTLILRSSQPSSRSTCPSAQTRRIIEKSPVLVHEATNISKLEKCRTEQEHVFMLESLSLPLHQFY